MYSLTYVSSASTRFSREALKRLLDQCAFANKAVGVTGMLLYQDGNFMQVLEGHEHSVRGLYAKIERDPRHMGLITLLQGEIEERQFPTWSMGFREITRDPGPIEDGYTHFMNSKISDVQFAANPTRAQSLLLKFKQGMELRG
jgi:hypothetical protein